MGTPARIVLVVGFGLVLVLALQGWRDGHGSGRPVHTALRGDGVVEGRVELDEHFVALRMRAGVPALVARVESTFGFSTGEVEDNGRFCISGLPICELDLELRLGGELLARVTGVTPRAASAVAGTDVIDDPRLFGIALAGPLRLIEVHVVGVDGVGLEHGWLAWRASGEAEYDRAVAVQAGRASIATCAEVVDVLPLIAGFEALEFACAVGGERLMVASSGPIVALAPEVPAGVMLRLEVALARGLPGVVGEAFLRSGEVRGGWADATGRAELEVVGRGPVVVQWGAYRRLENRLTRARGLRGKAVEVPVGGFGERRVVVPLELVDEPRRPGQEWSR